MKQTFCLFLLACFLLTACKTTSSTVVKADVKSEIVVGKETPGTLKFYAKNAKYSAEGGFDKWHFSKVNVPKQQDKDLTGMTASLVVETASVTEKADGLRQHLMKNDFLDVEKYPEASVEIKDVSKTEGNKYKGTAVVKIKTFSGEYPTTFELTVGKQWHVTGEVVIMRKVFELGVGNENIENEVKITFDTDLK